MEYTSLISATDFVGPKADMMVAVSALMGMMLVIVAVGIIYRVFGRG